MGNLKNYLTSFQDSYIAYRVIDGYNKAFNVKGWEEYKSGDLIYNLYKYQDDQSFHFIEYDKGARWPKKIYLDIDISIPESAIQPIYDYINQNIIKLYGESENEAPLYILRNNKSGKLHIILNANLSNLIKELNITEYRLERLLRTTAAKYIGLELYETVKEYIPDLTNEIWNHAVDVCNVHTLRAAYSNKYKDGILIPDYYEIYECKDKSRIKKRDIKNLDSMQILKTQYGKESSQYQAKLKEYYERFLDEFHSDDTTNIILMTSIFRPANGNLDARVTREICLFI